MVPTRRFMRGTVPHCFDMYLTAPLLKEEKRSLFGKKKIDFPYLVLNERFMHKKHEFQDSRAYIIFFASYKFFHSPILLCLIH